MKSKVLFSVLGFLALAVLAISLFLAQRETLNVLSPVAAVLALVALVGVSRRSSLVHAINVLPANLGTHEGGCMTYLADGAIASRNLLAKIGSDASHVTLAGTADIPIGVITDEAAAAEDPVAVELFGSSTRTKVGVASAAIAAGAFIVSAANGQVRTLPGTTGTYYIVGRALTAAGAAGDPIEFDPLPAIQRVVP